MGEDASYSQRDFSKNIWHVNRCIQKSKTMELTSRVLILNSQSLPLSSFGVIKTCGHLQDTDN